MSFEELDNSGGWVSYVYALSSDSAISLLSLY